MDDLQVVIYIVLVVIYIISRALRAKKKAGQSIPRIPRKQEEQEYMSESPAKPYQKAPESRQLTFEELLKEFSGYQDKDEETTVAPSRSPGSMPKKTSTDYQTPSTTSPYPTYQYEEPKSLETLESYEDYQYEEPKSLETLVSYDDLYTSAGKVEKSDTRKTDINEDRFAKYSTYETYNIHKASRFMKLLHNPTSIRDAIIMKEILDRKYF
jgi:hypothetical protein